MFVFRQLLTFFKVCCSINIEASIKTDRRTDEKICETKTEKRQRQKQTWRRIYPIETKNACDKQVRYLRSQIGLTSRKTNLDSS